MHHLVYFFCFRHHHTYTIFALKYYVVVILALRVPSSSVSLLHGFAPCLHTSFPICLLKFLCIHLTTKIASVLALFNKYFYSIYFSTFKNFFYFFDIVIFASTKMKSIIYNRFFIRQFLFFFQRF